MAGVATLEANGSADGLDQQHQDGVNSKHDGDAFVVVKENGNTEMQEENRKLLNPVAQYSQQLADRNLHIHKVTKEGVQWRNYDSAPPLSSAVRQPNGLQAALNRKLELLADTAACAIHANQKTTAKTLLDGPRESTDQQDGINLDGQETTGTEEAQTVNGNGEGGHCEEIGSSSNANTNGHSSNTPPSPQTTSGALDVDARDSQLPSSMENNSAADSDVGGTPLAEVAGRNDVPDVFYTSFEGTFAWQQQEPNGSLREAGSVAVGPSDTQSNSTQTAQEAAPDAEPADLSAGQTIQLPSAIQMYLKDNQSTHKTDQDTGNMTTAPSILQNEQTSHATDEAAPSHLSKLSLQLAAPNELVIPTANIIPPTPPISILSKSTSTNPDQQSPTSPVSPTSPSSPTFTTSPTSYNPSLPPKTNVPKQYITPSSSLASNSTVGPQTKSSSGSSKRSSIGGPPGSYARGNTQQPHMLSSAPLSYTTSAPTAVYNNRRSSMLPSPSAQSLSLPPVSHVSPILPSGSAFTPGTSSGTYTTALTTSDAAARKRSSSLSPRRALSFRSLTGGGNKEKEKDSAVIFDEPLTYEQMQLEQMREDQLKDSIARQAEMIRKERWKKSMLLEKEQKAIAEEKASAEEGQSNNTGASAGLNAVTGLEKEGYSRDRGLSISISGKARDKERRDSVAGGSYTTPLTPTSPSSMQAQLWGAYQYQQAQPNQGASSAVAGSKEGIYGTPAAKSELPEQDRVLVGNLIGEDHVNYVLMYNMLTGIRIGVSRCEAKVKRPLTDEDYKAKHKFSFDIAGNELTPSAKYDFKFKDYAPWVFRELRAHFHLDPADYLLSLTAKYILSELGSPGKSGSFFYFSRDYRFIIKTISHTEHKFLRKILKDYHKHVSDNPHTLISRFYGLHRVKMPRGKKIHFVIMNNLFPPHKDIHETYDLKGSSIGREYPEEKAAKNPRGTLKDLNWINRGKQLELGPIKRRLFEEQLKRDVELLQRLKIMDYSLLVGIHDMGKGNSEKLRDGLLTVFQPETSGKMRRRPTHRGDLEEAIALRRAVQNSDPKALSQDTHKLPKKERSERRYFLFYQEEGGIRATDDNDDNDPTIYYVGIIDILTPYNWYKKLEHFFRSFQYDKHRISAVPPDEYGDRFLGFLLSIIRNGDQSKRPKMS